MQADYSPSLLTHIATARAEQRAEARRTARIAEQEDADSSRRSRQLAEQSLRLDMSTRSVPMPEDVQLIVDTVVLAADIDAAADAVGVHPATLLEWMDQAGNRAHVDTIHRRRARAAAFDQRSVAADDRREPAARAIELKALTWEAERMDRGMYAERLPTDQPELQVTMPAAELLRAAMMIASQAGLMHELQALMPAIEGQSRQVPIAPVDKPE